MAVSKAVPGNASCLLAASVAAFISSLNLLRISAPFCRAFVAAVSDPAVDVAPCTELTADKKN